MKANLNTSITSLIWRLFTSVSNFILNPGGPITIHIPKKKCNKEKKIHF